MDAAFTEDGKPEIGEDAKKREQGAADLRRHGGLVRPREGALGVSSFARAEGHPAWPPGSSQKAFMPSPEHMPKTYAASAATGSAIGSRRRGRPHSAAAPALLSASTTSARASPILRERPAPSVEDVARRKRKAKRKQNDDSLHRYPRSSRVPQGQSDMALRRARRHGRSGAFDLMQSRARFLGGVLESKASASIPGLDLCKFRNKIHHPFHLHKGEFFIRILSTSACRLTDLL